MSTSYIQNSFLSEDAKRRQFFFLFLVCISIPVLLYFGLSELIIGNILEGWLDVFTSLFFAVTGLIFYKKPNKWYYRIFSAILIITIFYDLMVNVGNEFTWFWLNPFPVALYFLLGKKEGVFWALCMFLLILLFLYMPFMPYVDQYIPGDKFRFVISWLLIAGIAYALESARHQYFQKFIKQHVELLEEKSNLQEALASIKVLNGLLPICANCKKVRDDTGYWNQIEHYIKKHSDADFSLSMCPDCAKELYPEIDKFRSNPESKK